MINIVALSTPISSNVGRSIESLGSTFLHFWDKHFYVYRVKFEAGWLTCNFCENRGLADGREAATPKKQMQ